MSILTDIQDVYNDYYDVKLSLAQIFTVFTNVPEYLPKIKEFGARDTECRGYLIDSLCKYLGMKNMWPTYGADELYEKSFHEEFNEKLNAVFPQQEVANDVVK